MKKIQFFFHEKLKQIISSKISLIFYYMIWIFFSAIYKANIWFKFQIYKRKKRFVCFSISKSRKFMSSYLFIREREISTENYLLIYLFLFCLTLILILLVLLLLWIWTSWRFVFLMNIEIKVWHQNTKILKIKIESVAKYIFKKNKYFNFNYN